MREGEDYSLFILFVAVNGCSFDEHDGNGGDERIRGGDKLEERDSRFGVAIDEDCDLIGARGRKKKRKNKK